MRRPCTARGLRDATSRQWRPRRWRRGSTNAQSRRVDGVEAQKHRETASMAYRTHTRVHVAKTPQKKNTGGRPAAGTLLPQQILSEEIDSEDFFSQIRKRIEQRNTNLVIIDNFPYSIEQYNIWLKYFPPPILTLHIKSNNASLRKSLRGRLSLGVGKESKTVRL